MFFGPIADIDGHNRETLGSRLRITGGGGGGTSSPKLCIEARGKVHFEIVIATVVRNFDLISIQRSSRDMI